MKVYVSDAGDMSVGINPQRMEISLNRSLLPQGKDRENERLDIKKMAIEYFDFEERSIEVQYEDESQVGE